MEKKQADVLTQQIIDTFVLMVAGDLTRKQTQKEMTDEEVDACMHFLTYVNKVFNLFVVITEHNHNIVWYVKQYVTHIVTELKELSKEKELKHLADEMMDSIKNVSFLGDMVNAFLVFSHDTDTNDCSLFNEADVDTEDGEIYNA